MLLSDAGGGPTPTLTPTPLAADPGGGAAVTTAAASVAPVPGASGSTAPASDPPVTVSVVPDLLARQPRLATMTIHRYPLRNCYVPPRSPQYPTVSICSPPDRTVNVVLINKSQSRTRKSDDPLPQGSGAAATVERMRAPSVHSRRGVTLGGRFYGAVTYSGRLPALRVERLTQAGGDVTVLVPSGSAALVTVPPATG